MAIDINANAGSDPEPPVATKLRYRFGPFTLDVARGSVLNGNDEIKLRPKVYDLLRYLIERPGQLVGKEELMRAVWPESAVTDDSLVQCALELRRALGDRDHLLFKTVPRRGYLFTAPVTVSDATTTAAVDRSFDGAGSDDPRQTAVGGRKRYDLPTPRTSLVGREEQVTELAGFLLRPDIRLVCLTGPGGAGKTRLAIAAAAASFAHFTSGVQFVGLASIVQPDLVATALAAALHVKQSAARSIPRLIADELENSGPFLLLLDNFEQVLPAAAVVAEMLEECPSLKILVTSRSSLHIYGEHEFPVAPLARNSATELFAQRAAAVWPNFAITEENKTVIEEICRRLDGLPLAIELAAARAKVLSATAILARLETSKSVASPILQGVPGSSLQWLTTSTLDLPERHQTLRRTIDWSHGLLNQAEARLFRRLSVLVGGCTLEAVEAVCNTGLDLGVDAFDGLSSLVDQNLIHLTGRSETETRFTMLETIREYAFECLAGSGELSASRRAHAAYCLVLAEEGNPDLSPVDRARWLTQCDAEIVNFRFALDWLFETRELGWALRLCLALFRFWDMREHLIEGRLRLEAVLRLVSTDYRPERARALLFLGAIASAQADYLSAEQFLQGSLSLYEAFGEQSGIAASLNALAVSARDRGDYGAAQNFVERSLARWRTLPDRLSTARCLHNLADIAKSRGDFFQASSALREAEEIFATAGDRIGSAWSVNQQGDIARAQGDLAAAKSLYQSALSAFRETGDPWGAARSLTDLAYVDCAQGNYSTAHTACREALQIFAGLGHRRGIARAFESSACLAAMEGEAARALQLAAAATHLRRSVSAPLNGAEQSKLDQFLLGAWNSLGEPDGQRAWTEGSAMSLETAIECSLGDHASKSIF